MCSVVFLSIGALLGVIGLYLIRELEEVLVPPPLLLSLPPPLNYEEVGVVREVRSSKDIQLMSNEAYGPVQQSNNIHISPNTAYGHVNL